MSYILDALKKIEHEKTRKAKAGGMKGISGDLFTDRAPRPSRRGAWKITSVIVLVSLVTFAATWFMLKGDNRGGAVNSRLPVQSVVTAPAVPPGSSTPVLVTSQPPQQTPEPHLPVVAPIAQVAPQAGAAVSDDVDRVARSGRSRSKMPPLAPQLPKSAVQTIAAPADIKLSGIAWQEERAGRRAVINGFLLQEGKTVSGAKIQEIHQDRVRFTTAAGNFDVRMDAAVLPGIPK